jgi:hypothetical protein
MKRQLQKNWDLLLSYFFIVFAITMLLYGTSNCMGTGCAFAILITFALLFVSVLFLIISTIREIVSKESGKLIYIIIAIVIYALIIYFILQNIKL